MTERARRFMITGGAAGFFCFYLWGLLGLPGSGRYPGPYGDELNATAVFERHANDVVNAVTYDYRGFDTMGEEFILFSAVVGAAILVRKQKDESTGAELHALPGRSAPPFGAAARVLALGLTGPLLIFGFYLIAHGQLSPGGGFQGGAVVACAPLLIYLCGGMEPFHLLAGESGSEVLEAIGAGAYVLWGLGLSFAGAAFLQNTLPLGRTGSLASSGSILVISLITGVEVAGGFALLLIAYMQRVLCIREVD
jgi:multicomponent Na+:H+ antiporter subunit B